ncbi:cullin-associated NEDD8-dissociated protein 1-like isoform X1 [Gordionus sp. m RMFG-2023]|uniref:cullin-associated NEDD8-dissociated protein 1-like isoform X1 n=1 Tax=Gordionus sp. m RMFG-2023 TaxID=3053472 RepID=UPI0031FD879B
MASPTYHISNLLEKMSSADKDFRFMATNDLITELHKDSIKLDDETEKKVVKMILKLLEDKNGEVQNLAVKCLGPLVNKIKPYQVEDILITLCNNMLSDNEELRDISSIALKTVINSFPLSYLNSISSISQKLIINLIKILNKKDTAIQLEALDIMGDILNRFGSLISNQQALIEEALIPLISSQRLAVRKRSIIALSYLTIICSSTLFNKIMDYLIEQIHTNKVPSITHSYIQCIGAISRTSGSRLSSYIPKFVPILIGICQDKSGTMTIEENDEMIEYCLQTFESIFKCCYNEILPHMNELIDLSLKFASYDPNYNYDDSQMDSSDFLPLSETNKNNGIEEKSIANENNGIGNEVENEDNFNDNEDSLEEDDEDMSWKVRRAASKCLKAIIECSTLDMLPRHYSVVSAKLIGRFKEREENVKLDLIQAYLALLKQTKILLSSNVENIDLYKKSDKYLEEHMDDDDGHRLLSPIDNVELSIVVGHNLKDQIPMLLKALKRLIRHKSHKIRQICFTLLTQLTLTLPGGCLKDSMSTLVSGIIFSLTDNNNTSSGIKIDVLTFLSHLLKTHSHQVFYPYIHQLIPALLNAINDPFYKIVAEALNVTEQLVQIMRPAETKASSQLPFDYTPYIVPLYQSTLQRLNITDIDQEVKERAISCMARIIQFFGDKLDPQLNKTCLLIFNERMKNEITRLEAVKAIKDVTESHFFQIDIFPLAKEFIQSLSHFLRKNNRALKIISLLTLNSLIKRYSEPDCINDYLMIELPVLISDNDLRITDLVLRLLSTICRFHPSCIYKAWTVDKDNKGDNKNYFVQSLCRLIMSPLLQGEALRSLLRFFLDLVMIRSPHPLDMDKIIELITQPIYNYHQNLQTFQSNNNSIMPARLSSSPVQNQLQLNRVPLGFSSPLPPAPNQPVNFNSYNDENLTAIHKQALVNIAKVVGIMVSASSILKSLPSSHSENLNYADNAKIPTPNPKQIELAQRSLAQIRQYLTTISQNNNARKHSLVDNSLPMSVNNSLNERVVVIFSLLCLGEMGKECDLYTYFEDVLQENVCDLMSVCFKSPCEDIKFAAAYALGNIGSGNLYKFIPYILLEIQKSPNKQYLPLHALKEILNDRSPLTFSRLSCHNVKPIWSALLDNINLLGSGEEGTRNVISECLGEFCALDPEGLIPALDHTLSSLNNGIKADDKIHLDANETSLSATKSLAKCTVVASIIHCVSSTAQQRNQNVNGGLSHHLQSQVNYSGLSTCSNNKNQLDDNISENLDNPIDFDNGPPSFIQNQHNYPKYAQQINCMSTIDKLLKNHFGSFLSSLQDGDPNVRRMGLIALNCAAHNKPFLVRDSLKEILPYLYNETKIRKELIREVEMGPFKHSVDDGLDLRKTSYECMYTLVDSPTCFEKLDLDQFLNHVETGLKDHYDIKMLTYLMLSRLACLCPSALLLPRIERLLEPLKTILNSKVKANSVKQEFEKQEDLKRCALRASISLLTLPDADKNAFVIEFQNFVKSNTELNAIYDSLNKEISSTHTN